MCVCVCVRQREKYGNFRIKYFQNQSELFLWITTNYYRLLFSFSLSFFFHRFSLALCYAIPCNRGGEKNCKFQVILYARFESDRYIILVLDRPTEEIEVLYLLLLSRMNEKKEREGKRIESNRLCASQRLSIFKKRRALASLLAPIRRAP